VDVARGGGLVLKGFFLYELRNGAGCSVGYALSTSQRRKTDTKTSQMGRSTT